MASTCLGIKLRRGLRSISRLLFGLGIAIAALATPALASSAYVCVGPSLKLFDNSNTSAVGGGGDPATFGTHGRVYCLVSITTVHWNAGQGATPGKVGLKVISGLGGAGSRIGPLRATGSSASPGAGDVDWTVSVPAQSAVVLDGSYACTDSDPGTWSANLASGEQGFCKVYVRPAVHAPVVTAPPVYKCTGPQVTLLNNSNLFGVSGGGKPPSFNTQGRPYCVRALVTYHWNRGAGKLPGTLGLRVVSGLGGAGATLGPWKATGSSGQGGVPDVNWSASPPAVKAPVVIDGTYTCIDSDPASWAQNRTSGGHGFCQVYAVKAVRMAGRRLARTGRMPRPPAGAARAASEA